MFPGGTRNRFWIALVLSLVLHAILGGGLVLTPKRPTFSKSAPVELMSPEEMQAMLEKAAKAQAERNAKQIVDAGEKRINDELDKNAKYLSRYNQTVVKETKAAKHGKFENTAGQGPTKAPRAPQPAPTQGTPVQSDVAKSEAKSLETSKEKPLNIDIDENGDVSVGGTAKPKTGLQAFSPSFRKLPRVPDPTQPTAENETAPGDGREQSATDDHLKDVPTGMQTMLSTREFVYYSYYNRIKDKLRQYWEPKIKEKFERVVRQGRHIATEGDKITKVIIILDDRGTLIKVQVLSASGVQDLDDAAVEAFRAAAPFPNPPKGIVEDDGTIKIRWDFVLEA